MYLSSNNKYKGTVTPLLGKSVRKMNSNIRLIELKDLGHLPQIGDFKLFYSELDKILLN